MSIGAALLRVAGRALHYLVHVHQIVSLHTWQHISSTLATHVHQIVNLHTRSQPQLVNDSTCTEPRHDTHTHTHTHTTHTNATVN